MQKHKIDGALNQNTNSNHNFKTNQIRTKKKKKGRANLSLGAEDMRWWEEKKGTHLTHLRVRKRERFLNALEQTKCQRKKRKKKSEETKCQKRIEKRKRSEDKSSSRRKEKSKVKMEIRVGLFKGIPAPTKPVCPHRSGLRRKFSAP